MKSGKPLVLVVSRRITVERGTSVEHVAVQHGSTVKRSRTAARDLQSSRPRRPSCLLLVASNGVRVASVAPAAPRAAAQPPARGSRTLRAPRSLSRPFGQGLVQAVQDVGLLALALLAGLRPRA